MASLWAFGNKSDALAAKRAGRALKHGQRPQPQYRVNEQVPFASTRIMLGVCKETITAASYLTGTATWGGGPWSSSPWFGGGTDEGGSLPRMAFGSGRVVLHNVTNNVSDPDYPSSDLNRDLRDPYGTDPGEVEVLNFQTRTFTEAENPYAIASGTEILVIAEDAWGTLWVINTLGQSQDIVYYEVIEHKSYITDAVQALPVGVDGVIIGDPEDPDDPNLFYIFDDEHQFYGEPAIDFQRGYRGVAQRYLDDYGGSGLPGYRIITMEGPAQLLVVQLQSDYSMAGTPTLTLTSHPFGKPFRGRRLPYTGPITVHDSNAVASNAKNGDKWLAAWDDVNEQYDFIVDLSRTSTAPVISFELTYDKHYNDTQAPAQPLLSDGTIDSAAAEILVIDENKRFYGKAAVEGVAAGYQGTGLWLTDNYNDTGKAGYRIITMQGPAHLLVVTAAEDYDAGGTSCAFHAKDVFGKPFRGEKLPPDMSSLDVYDDFNIATSVKTGQKWLCVWQETDERYTFLLRLDTPTPETLECAMLQAGDVPAMDHSDIDGGAFTATPGFTGLTTPVAYVMKWEDDLPPRRVRNTDDYPDPLPAINETETPITYVSTEPVLVYGYVHAFQDPDDDNNLKKCFIVVREDHRSDPSFDRTKAQVPYHAAGSGERRWGGFECT